MKEHKNCPYIRTAAYLHDIGHLLVEPSNIPSDDRHELIGSNWLKTLRFSPYVYEPIKLHVLAKRYLVTTQRGYYDTLSDASKITFGLQGGFMTFNEIKAFKQNPFFLQALVLRDCDDNAKNLSEVILTPDIENQLSRDLEMSIISESNIEEIKLELNL
jgi:predicted HD phosphohydrolase